jgi:hypothetical protein
MDTRPGHCEDGPRCGAIAGGTTFAMPRPAVLPPTATAAVLNVAVVTPRARGHLTVWPSGAPPLASSMNYMPGDTTANMVVAGLQPGDTGSPAFLVSPNIGVHVVVDVLGYYEEGAGNRYVALDPRRVLDSRTGNGRPAWHGAFRPGSTDLLPATLLHGVPGAATALLYNLAATASTATGHLTAFPGATPVPGASNLNFGPGRTVANAAVVRAGGPGCSLGYVTEGCVAILASTIGTVQVIMDLSGYFVPEETLP